MVPEVVVGVTGVPSHTQLSLQTVSFNIVNKIHKEMVIASWY